MCSVCVDMWEEIRVIISLLFLWRTYRKKQRLQPKATWVDLSCISVCVCSRLSFLFVYSSSIIGAARRVPELLWEGGLWLHFCSPIAVTGLWGACCVCMSAGPVCVHRAGGGRDGESGQLELAGWVMNLLLRHSLKHNYTHQSQKGLSRPLNLS